MPLTQDRMLAILKAAEEWKATAERLAQLFWSTNAALKDLPLTDWPSVWSGALLQVNTNWPSAVAFTAVYMERAHFTACGARNTRERRRQAARRAGLPPMARPTRASRSDDTWTCLICEEPNPGSRRDCQVCFQPRGAKPRQAPVTPPPLPTETIIDLPVGVDFGTPPPAMPGGDPGGLEDL